MSSKMLHNWGLWQLGHTSFLDFPAAVQCTAMGHRGHLAIRMQTLCLAFKKLIWVQFQLRIWDLRDLTWPLVSQESRAPRSSASKCYTQCKDASSTQHQQRPYYNWRKNVQRWQLRKPWPGDNLSKEASYLAEQICFSNRHAVLQELAVSTSQPFINSESASKEGRAACEWNDHVKCVGFGSGSICVSPCVKKFCRMTPRVNYPFSALLFLWPQHRWFFLQRSCFYFLTVVFQVLHYCWYIVALMLSNNSSPVQVFLWVPSNM